MTSLHFALVVCGSVVDIIQAVPVQRGINPQTAGAHSIRIFPRAVAMRFRSAIMLESVRMRTGALFCSDLRLEARAFEDQEYLGDGG